MRSLALVAVAWLQGCEPTGIAPIPPSSPFPGSAVLEQGVAVGDVTSTSAVLWSRTVGPSTVRIEWEVSGGSGVSMPGAVGRNVVKTKASEDFTLVLPLEALKAGTDYRYRVLPLDGSGLDPGALRKNTAEWSGRFGTAPPPEHAAKVRFIWSADLGGQQRCRQGDAGYPIFDRMREVQPMFGVLLGDLIYADDRCPSPPNEPGGDFLATTLDQFRAKHRYQRGAAALQRFLANVPVYVTWDDHEVHNNFSGPYDPLTPMGQQALLEYWPIQRSSLDAGRLYRSIRWGRTLELFLLDTRQYRDRNDKPDGPDKTMLGKAQREWLLDGLTKSTAIWKVIGTSVPLSIPKGGTLRIPGNDSWARGGDGTGFRTELSTIVQTLLDRRVRNVVWLAADVHYARAHVYDPDADGTADFHEFISGPLSASYGPLVEPEPILRPRTVFSETGFSNFGLVTADETGFRVEIRDDRGAIRHAESIDTR